MFVVDCDMWDIKLLETCGLTCTARYDLLCICFYVLHAWNAY